MTICVRASTFAYTHHAILATTIHVLAYLSMIIHRISVAKLHDITHARAVDIAIRLHVHTLYLLRNAVVVLMNFLVVVATIETEVPCLELFVSYHTFCATKVGASPVLIKHTLWAVRGAIPPR